MGLNLRLYFIRPEDFPKRYLNPDETLRVLQDYRIYGLLTDMSDYHEREPEIPEKPVLTPKPLPDNVWLIIKEDGKDNTVRLDRYGQALCYLYVEQLKTLRLPAEISPKNKGVFAYINALPNDTPVVLWWS